MLWYKDKRNSLFVDIFSALAVIFAVAVVAFTLGYVGTKLQDKVCPASQVRTQTS